MHSEEARSYWTNKEKTEGHLADYVNWDAISSTMKSTELTKRIFITKHTVGMCGVGKFMKIWKQRDSEICPRCDEPEDATHIWKCQGAEANGVWKKSLSNLDDWMTSVQTDPDIQQALLTSLNNWRFSEDTEFYIPFSLKMVIEQQHDIGWSLFLEGWTSFEWEHVQQAY